MFGWSISASACRSASKRAITSLRVHARLDDLERDLAADRLLLLGHVDDAEAAFADLLQQLVGADDRAGAFGDGANEIGGSWIDGRSLEETAGLLMRASAAPRPPPATDHRFRTPRRERHVR